MSRQGSSGEDYAARRLREIQRDINRGTYVDWATEEEIAARKADMDRSVREEVRRAASRQSEGQEARGSRPSPMFVGSINAKRSYSHYVQGTMPPSEDPRTAPLLSEAHRVADEFCEQFRVLNAEVAILEAENTKLRQRIQQLLTQLAAASPPSKK